MSLSLQVPFSRIAEFAVMQQRRAAQRGHRASLVLSGERGWCREAAEAVVSALSLPRLCWLGDAPPASVTLRVSAARELLGRELDGVVLDAWSGFDAEAFGAVAGSLRAGGVMLLLSPRLSQWHEYADPAHARLAVTPYTLEAVSGRFLQHMAATLRDSPGVNLIGQDEPLSWTDSVTGPDWFPGFDAEGVTPEQREAIAAIEHVVHGHRRRPLVLSSDRGRGKTTALGIAAARLLQQSVTPITVTAPRMSAVAPLFEHAARLLPGAERQRGLIRWQGRRIEFVAPDALTLSAHETGLLLVDEAAAIPTPLLERMLAQYARIVFASTIHGYEGTGRGFALRFQNVLNQRAPGWQVKRLSRPVRWAEDDPLERLSFRALMLDAESADDALLSAADVAHCRFEQLERERLVHETVTLSELFGLLVMAHYRTSPNDLRYLLDGPDVRVYVLRYHGHIAATAVVAEEGGLPPDLAGDIYQGHRRAHGHLMAQSLAVHAGFVEAPTLRGWRVVRIAVHPAVARRGLGRALLQRIAGEAARHRVDYVGASFGADRALLAFWQDSAWLPVRIGLSRDAASGTHSVMVMNPLSEAGESLFLALRWRFAEQLPLLLAESLTELDADLGVALHRRLPVEAYPALCAQDWRDLHSFAEARRGYEVCLLALRRLLPTVLSDEALLSRLDESQQRMLVKKVFQRQGWAALATALGMQGKAEVVVALRACFRDILAYYRENGMPQRQVD